MSDYFTFAKVSLLSTICTCILHKVNEKLHPRVLCFLLALITEAEDYTTLWNTLRESISLVQNDKEFKPGQGSFGHLFSGYDAGYYGYMYSLVFATDMYETIFKKDPLSPELGL